MYRNYQFYKVILRNMSEEKAFKYVSDNLAAPSFENERANAERAWLERFGYPYMSPERKKLAEMEAKIAKLEAEQAAKKVEKKIEKDSSTNDSDAGNVPVQLDRKTWTELFLAKHPEATKMVVGKAWSNYKKEVGITE